MRFVLTLVALAMVGTTIIGCGGRGLAAYDGYRLGEARETIVRGVEAIGVLQRWKGVREVRANALMTVYGEDGRPYVNRQAHRIDVNGRKIRATASTACGNWRARCSGRGKFSLKGRDALKEITPEELQEALSTILHRVCGPMNLLKSEKAGETERVWLNSKDLVRVPVENSEIKAYYFDASSGLLELVTCGSDRPGREGTVTLYAYQTLPGGVVFPKKISVVRTVEHVLIGGALVMEVEYSDVTIR